MADENERARRMGTFVVVALVSGGLTYAITRHEADAHVLEVETNAATQIAECQEHGAATRIALEGELAGRSLDRAHARCATLGDRVGQASITSVDGRTDVHATDTCALELDWNTDPIEGCRAFVRCGDVPLYGDLGSGFFECTVDEDGIVRGEDAEPTRAGEGDPRIVVDRESATITLSDDTPHWQVVLSVPALREAELETETP